MKFNTQIDKALKVAAVAHRKQNRKGSDTPYIIHPFAVMYIASRTTDDEDVLIACLLHDILEDVPKEYSKEQMPADFGERVVSIVEGVTKNSTLKSWKERSDAYLKHLEFQASDESVIVSCADKIHNLMSIIEDYKILGDDLWSRFNSDKQDQLWWYKSVCAVVKRRLPNLPLIKDYEALISELEQLIKNND
jgi:(p)ppGpp synthase/HD superfamily hydrolase